jgi:sporulation protein YunB
MRKKRTLLCVPILITAVLSFFVFHSLSIKLKPTIETLARSKAINLISVAISEETDLALSGDGVEYSDFVSAATDESGQISMLSLRTADSTRFKRLVTERLADRLESLDPSTLAIPLGTLTNVIPFSALGPSVRVRVQSVGDIQTSYVNEFTSAGVNQTKHSIYLQVDVTVYLLIPGEIVPVTVQDRVCVAETIIVGEVPDTYLNFKNGAN